MKKIYVQPNLKSIDITYKDVLCTSGETIKKIKKYGCPIKDGVDCQDYDKRMYEYERWIKNLANRQDSAIFHQGPDENYCPRKSCFIYLEWKQQKNR